MKTWIARRLVRTAITLARLSHWLIGDAHRALLDEECERVCLLAEMRDVARSGGAR